MGLTTLPPTCANCLKMWEPQTLEPARACPDIVAGITLLFPLQLCGMHKHKCYEVNGYTSVQNEV